MILILVWCFVIVLLGFIWAYFSMRHNKKIHKQNLEKLEKALQSDIDTDFGHLGIEDVGGEFVSSFSINRRGSWRLAQGRILTYEHFEKMKDLEYKRMLK